MNENYTKGIALIMEGTTEKVFYCSLLEWLANRNGYNFKKIYTTDLTDIFYEWYKDNQKIIIKINVVGTVTQISNSGNWFKNTCAKRYKIPWSVFLCYDTDSYEDDISKFYEDDWKNLRKQLKGAKAARVVDLSAKAEIEDIMLIDLPGICEFLKIGKPEALHGRTGKAKIKALYRSCGSTYHEGEKCKAMIDSLDFKKILDEAPIELNSLIEELL